MRLQTLSWCPVDVVASVVHDLAIRNAPANRVYHIENPQRQRWCDMSRMIAEALGIPLTGIVSFEAWVERVRSYDDERHAANPAKKIIDFLEEHFVRMDCGGLVLGTQMAREHSRTLREVRAVDAVLVRKYVDAWRRMEFLSA